MIDRTKFIGASEVPAIFNEDSFMTPLKLWSIKTGKIVQDDLSDNQSVEWGKRLERVVSEKFSESHGVKLMAYKKRFVHPTMPFFSCELDNIIVGTEELVEIKTVNANAWKHWSNPDELPAKVILQVMAQMGLSNRKKAWVACLCGGQKYIEKEIKFDEDLWFRIESSVKDFWENYVLADIMPMTYGPDNKIMVELFPNAGERVKEATEDVSNAISLLQQTKRDIIALEKTQDEIEAKIKKVIENDLGIRTPEYTARWINVKGSTYTVTKKDTRMLKITKNKGV